MIEVQQLFVGGFDDNLSYLLNDPGSGDTAIVDPCGDTGIIRKSFRRLKKARPRYILVTHGHGDHISGLDAVLEFFAAPVVAHPSSPVGERLDISDRQRLAFGDTYVECLFAPGHSKDGIVYHLGDDSAVFTGDTLFIDYCGYCDAKTMFRTLREIVFPLADSNIVYSGHDYGRSPHAPLGEEKIKNPYLSAKTLEKFAEELKNL